MPVKRDQSLTLADARGAAKRSRVEGGNHPNTMAQFVHLNTKNAALKGPKRFLADLEDMSGASAAGLTVNTLQAVDLRSGDDEGNIMFNVMQAGASLLPVTLLVSDAMEYPEEHTFYAFSSGSNVNPVLMAVIEDIPEYGPRTIFQTVTRILRSVSLKLNLEDDGHITDGSVEIIGDGSDEDEDVMMDSDDEVAGISARATSSSFSLAPIQSDFLEIVACSPDYRPGFIRFGNDSFAMTISTPVVNIPVPPNVLQAWDRVLLASTRHLTLLITGLQNVYPVLARDGSMTLEAIRRSVSLNFQLGLTPRNKPSRTHAQAASRSYVLVVEEEETLDPLAMEEDLSVDYGFVPPPKVEEPEDAGVFERFALSQPLEALLNHNFLNMLRIRLKFKVGWAGAEMMQAIIDKTQSQVDEVYHTHKKSVKAADQEERRLANNYNLPPDPLVELELQDHINLPLVAFAYTLRRFMLCSRFCTVCHDKVNLDHEVLKPYVCSNSLCQYQYYDLHMGSSLEHDIISRAEVVDVLISTTYASAGEGALDPRPLGLGLRVPLPSVGYAPVAARAMMVFDPAGAPVVLPTAPDPAIGSDQLVDFDQLSLPKQHAAVKLLLDKIPNIIEMQRAIEKKRKAGKLNAKLAALFPTVPIAAWTLVRWCINSCIAHLEPLTGADEMIQNIDSSWKQYRFSMGAPDAEARFKAAVVEAQKTDSNARQYPMLYAFHGSPFRNWHSIIRNGLWFKEITNGRSYGNGVYFALQGETSMNSYAAGGRVVWPNSALSPMSCAAVAEIVNQPDKFVSRSPYLVVAQTEWIVCRYLLVKVTSENYSHTAESESKIPLVKFDPHFKVTVGRKAIGIPDPTYKLDVLLRARRAEVAAQVDEHDEDDASVFQHGITQPTQEGSRARPVVVSSDEDGDPDDYDESWAHEEDVPVAGPSMVRAVAPLATKDKGRPADDWTPDADWVWQTVEHLLMPPSESTPGATRSIQRELKAMLDEQKQAPSLRELGWYMPPAILENNDNLFQWIVELHSFEEPLPIAQDLKARGINSLVFEIRFPPTFPHSPPFFRIIKPRFLPFFQGGGGHVTGGGSLCMDLLTADGWLPSYSISAVLLQIKLAISNLDPRPARLSPQWQLPYSPTEALQGFQRAAATHGWKVPDGLTKMIR